MKQQAYRDPLTDARARLAALRALRQFERQHAQLTLDDPMRPRFYLSRYEVPWARRRFINRLINHRARQAAPRADTRLETRMAQATLAHLRRRIHLRGLLMSTRELGIWRRTLTRRLPDRFVD